MQNGEKAKAAETYFNNDLVFPNELGEPTDPRNLTKSYYRVMNNVCIKIKIYFYPKYYYKNVAIHKLILFT
jgi:hypothetical protein